MTEKSKQRFAGMKEAPHRNKKRGDFHPYKSEGLPLIQYKDITIPAFETDPDFPDPFLVVAWPSLEQIQLFDFLQ